MSRTASTGACQRAGAHCKWPVISSISSLRLRLVLVRLLLDIVLEVLLCHPAGTLSRVLMLWVCTFCLSRSPCMSSIADKKLDRSLAVGAMRLGIDIQE